MQLLHSHQNDNIEITFLWYIGIFGSFYCYNQKMPGEGHLELFLSFQYFDILVWFLLKIPHFWTQVDI